MTKSQTEGKKDISTYSNIKVPDLNFDDIKNAIDLIEPIPKQHFEMCKKHFKSLKEQVENKEATLIGSLYGIEIRVKPYLKKIRLYTELLPVKLKTNYDH